jgi:hypothetical protein
MVGVVTASNTHDKHPINYLQYKYHEPNGTLYLASTNQFALDSINTTCGNDEAERDQQSGWYLATTSLYWISQYVTPPTLKFIAPLQGIIDAL